MRARPRPSYLCFRCDPARNARVVVYVTVCVYLCNLCPPTPFGVCISDCVCIFVLGCSRSFRVVILFRIFCICISHPICRIPSHPTIALCNPVSYCRIQLARTLATRLSLPFLFLPFSLSTLTFGKLWTRTWTWTCHISPSSLVLVWIVSHCTLHTLFLFLLSLSLSHLSHTPHSASPLSSTYMQHTWLNQHTARADIIPGAIPSTYSSSLGLRGHSLIYSSRTHTHSSGDVATLLRTGHPYPSTSKIPA